MKNKLSKLFLFTGLIVISCGSDPEPWYAGPYLGTGITKEYYLDKDFSGSEKIHGSEEYIYEDTYVSCNLARSDGSIILVLQDVILPAYIRGEMEGNTIIFPVQPFQASNFESVSGVAVLDGKNLTLKLTYVDDSFFGHYKYSELSLVKL